MPYKCSSSNCQKYKLPKFFQSLVHEKCKLWFLSINELLIIYWQKNTIYTFHLLKMGKIEVTCIFGSFNYHKENMPFLCVFQKIFWNTAFTGVVYYVNIKTSSTSQNSLGVISINSRTADPILDKKWRCLIRKCPHYDNSYYCHQHGRYASKYENLT